MKKFKIWIQKESKEMKILLKSIPALVITLFTISVVSMNLLANKTILDLPWIALDGGILVSWLSFLCMDMIVKRFGPKASTKISILAMLINLIMCLIFFIVSAIPTINDFSGFNMIFGGTWFVLLGSTIAFLSSAVINNVLNWLIGKAFKKDANSKLAYFTRTYVSTFIGQFMDNLIFSLIVFMIFGPIFWNFGWSFIQCLMCSLTGAVVELLFEVVFSPIGYRVCKKWDEENIGHEYLEFINLEKETEEIEYKEVQEKSSKKSRTEYQRAYRARKKLEALKKEDK